MAYWTEHSLLIAPQISGFGTPNTTDADFEAFLCDAPKVSKSVDKQELELLSGVVGAAPERLWGKKGATITVSMPLEGMKAGYDPTAEDPGSARGVIPYWLALVANCLGSQISASVDTAAKFWQGDHLSNSGYTASGVTSATSTAITLDNATASDKVLVGELVATAASASTSTVQFGWAKAKAGQVVTLFEASGNTVNSGTANVYGTSNAWLSSAHQNQIPLTIRWTGEDTKFCYIFQDCVVESWKVSYDSGAVPTIEFQFRCLGGFTMDKTKGGLVVPDSMARIPQIVGSVNGRATLGYWNDAVTSLTSAVTCGLESCSLEYTTEIKEVKCHSGTQGISAVYYKKPRVKVSCSVLHTSDDLVYDAAGSAGNTGSHQLVSRMERNVRMSAAVYVGSQVGKLWSFLLPAGVISEAPQVQDRDGAVAYQLTLEAGSYSGDSTDTAETSSTSPLDSAFRTAVG